MTREDLLPWKNCEAIGKRPPVMIIETYFDTADLTNNQSLVVVDELGRRWDVEEALNTSGMISSDNSGTEASEVIIERWQVKLDEPLDVIPTNLPSILPRVYRNSIVLYRSLYTYTMLLPAWQSLRKGSKGRSSHGRPKLKYRVIAAPPNSSQQERPDALTLPLFDHHGAAVDKHVFHPIDSPAGELSIQVIWRCHSDFRVVDSEALLSSQFMGMDDQRFEPSLGKRNDVERQQRDHGGGEAGSLPPIPGEQRPRPDRSQAYGSLSTFHQVGPSASSSPLSALRAAGEMGEQCPITSQPNKRPGSGPSIQGSKSSLRSTEGAPKVGRRPSVSFMPFKTPSLSASPSQSEPMNASNRPASIGRASALTALAEARAPSSLSPQSSMPSKGSPVVPPVSGSGSSSPKPAQAPKYTSSFGHRKAKHSSGGSKTEDDNNSSGKTSLNSSTAQPGSGVLAEGGGSSGSIPTDDDNISDFLKLLDRKKDLKSFRATRDGSAADAATRRTSAALSKFQQMRDSNAALSDSISSSLLLHRSSSSSSRQPSSVPPMLAGTSTSTSSSPGKPISPHTPHTPAIPSRLSANSIIEYPRTAEDNQRQRDGVNQRRVIRSEGSQNPRTGAIDIPTSPRPFHPSYRRSSSVAQQPRILPVEEDFGDMYPFGGLRSASLGADDRPLLSPSTLADLFRLHDGSAVEDPGPEDSSLQIEGETYGPMPDPNDTGEAIEQQQPSSLEGRGDTTSLPMRGLSYRPRIGRGSGRGQTPLQGSLSSLGDRGSGSESSDQRSRRYSSSRPSNHFEDGEPLLFAMSDFGGVQQSRRSVEEARGGYNAGASDRGKYFGMPG